MRLTWISGLVASLGLAVVLSLTVPAAMDREARAEEVSGHEQRLEQLAGIGEEVQGEIDEVGADLDAQKAENDAAAERTRKQAKRIGALKDRIEELEA